MKTKTLLIAAVMFLGISVAAFAQATYTVGYVPVPTVVSSGHTEKSGDITFTTIPTSGATVTGTIVLTYSSRVTFNGQIQYVEPQGGAVGNPPIFSDPPTLDATGKVLTITITPAGVNPEPYYGFRLTGVRLDVVGEGTPLYASIETTGNAIVVGQNNVTVITDSKQGIASFTIAPTLAYNTMGEEITAGPTTLTVGEGFLYAFGVGQTVDPTQNISQMIKIGVNQALPPGVVITFPATDSTGNWALATKAGSFSAPQSTISSANPAVYYRIIDNASSNLIAVENFVLNGVYATFTEYDFPTYTPATFTAYASLALISTEFSPENVTAIPRYAADNIAANIPLLTIGASAINTTLMIPYATTEVGYDTGIAIANTTKDPGGTIMGISNGAFPQTGKIVFYCYNNDGVVTTIDTSNAAVKASLDAQDASFPLTAAGALESGKSYAVVLSQLLTAAGADADFHGYIIIVTDFTNAHGQYFLTNWNFFSNGAQMLVLGGNRADDFPEDNDH